MERKKKYVVGGLAALGAAIVAWWYFRQPKRVDIPPDGGNGGNGSNGNVPPVTPPVNEGTLALNLAGSTGTKLYSVRVDVTRMNETSLGWLPTTDKYLGYTDIDGNVQFVLPFGTYRAMISKAGYNTVNLDITIDSGMIKNEAITLYTTSESPEQPPVLVQTASIFGRVYGFDTRNVMSNVKVATQGKSTYTDASGVYRIDQLYAGTSAIEFTKAYYQPRVETRTLEADKATEIIVYLAKIGGISPTGNGGVVNTEGMG